MSRMGGPGWGPGYSAPPGPYAPPPPRPALPGYPAQPGFPPGYGAAPPPAAREARPVAVTIAATLTVTAGLQVAALVGFCWLCIVALLGELDPNDAAQAALYHPLNRAHLALQQGLAWPLLGFPLAAFALGWFVVSRWNWSRIALTALGVLACGWMLWWGRDQLGLVLVPALYIVICCGLLWLPGTHRWYSPRRYP